MKKTERKLIVGLGNLGEEYQETRHNVGFMFIDFLVEQYNCQLTEKTLKSSIIFVHENLVLAKPQTFMNKSGLAVKELVKWFEVDIKESLILVHDDLDIPLGEFKYQFAKSPKKHNGVQSVEDHLSTKDFNRLRIGVDNRGKFRTEGMKYVLENFKQQELIELDEVFSQILENESYL